jgi:glycosyltransferase involved in cell wall biosynthesis
MSGALGEIAQGGGCVDLGEAGAPALARAIEGLLASPPTLSALEEAARRRRFKAWPDYARELLAWMKSLRRNA